MLRIPKWPIYYRSTPFTPCPGTLTNFLQQRTWWDVGTYDFVEPKVAQMYRMVQLYERAAEPSQTCVYQLDVRLRQVEKAYEAPDRASSLASSVNDYRSLCQEITDFIHNHGALMLDLVEQTLQAIDTGLLPQAEEEWGKKAHQTFANAEATDDERDGSTWRSKMAVAVHCR